MEYKDIENEDPESLLFYIAAGNEEEQKVAFNVFHNRFKGFVKDICQYHLPNLVDSKNSDDLFNEVLMRIYQRAAQYDSSKPKYIEDKRKRVELWIYHIAGNMAIDWRRTGKKRLKKNEEYVPIYINSKKEGETEWIPLDDEAAEIFEKEFNKLNDRDREIIIQSGLYFNLERGESDMPTEVVQQIANDFDTTPENIRQVRSRFMKRVRKKAEKTKK